MFGSMSRRRNSVPHRRDHADDQQRLLRACRVTTPTLPVQYPQCACAAAIYAAALAASGKLVTRCRTDSGLDGPSPVISCCRVAVPSSRYDGTADRGNPESPSAP